ncbi:MAG: type II toxin-antitoxin system PemK/MazF family toxin [Enterobacteriaceae bacterium]|jgi:mRNA interferase MazF|nr:type II toxin-antitoxin system PemK/MazF family toxin [Enterobacteriaceae bacterium]
MEIYTPDRGDLIWLEFDPSLGEEIQKRRPALVLSPHIFNTSTNFAMVVPVTSTVRNHGFEVALTGTKTKGVAVCQQVKCIAFRVRGSEFIEKAPCDIVKKALTLVRAIVA